MLNRNQYQGTGAPKVRILVLGDTGVGKSTLVKRLCNEEVGHFTKHTVGCSVEVMSYVYRETNTRLFVEFFDCSGSSKYALSRKIFYSQINGILLVFDNTNSISYHNLKKWITELTEHNRVEPLEESYRRAPTTPLGSGKSYIDSRFSDLKLGQLPVACVGTKCDQKTNSKINAKDVLKQFGIECYFVDSLSENFDLSMLDNFFDEVIQRRHFAPHSDFAQTESSKIYKKKASFSESKSPTASHSTKEYSVQLSRNSGPSPFASTSRYLNDDSDV